MQECRRQQEQWLVRVRPFHVVFDCLVLAESGDRVTYESRQWFQSIGPWFHMVSEYINGHSPPPQVRRFRFGTLIYKTSLGVPVHVCAIYSSTPLQYIPIYRTSFSMTVHGVSGHELAYLRGATGHVDAFAMSFSPGCPVFPLGLLGLWHVPSFAKQIRKRNKRTML